MKSLEFLNQDYPKIQGNQNRDSSLCKSSQGYVIHSGIHRSTAFVSPTKFPDTYSGLEFWKFQGQGAINGFIETIIDGGSVKQAEFEACKRALPDWTLTQGKGCGTQGNSGVTATRTLAYGQERVGGADCRDLIARIRSASECQRAQWRVAK